MFKTEECLLKSLMQLRLYIKQLILLIFSLFYWKQLLMLQETINNI